MSDQTPVPADSPLMQAWEAYQRTEDFANSRTWARIPYHTEGSMWAAFVQGWQAREALREVEGDPAPSPPTTTEDE